MGEHGKLSADELRAMGLTDPAAESSAIIEERASFEAEIADLQGAISDVKVGGPVQGGGDTEGGPLIPEKVGPTPEPDVLKRCRCSTEEQGLVAPPEGCPMHSWLGTAHEVLTNGGYAREAMAVADAIAEIECARGENRDLEWRMMSLEAQLREYTEAKPAAYGVFSDGKLHDMVHDSRFDAELWVVSQYGGDTSGVSIRALAVVVTKGDKGGGET